jgi:uncharacterized protein (DUF4415 family)
MPKQSQAKKAGPSASDLAKLDAMTDKDIKAGVDADSDAAPLDLDLSQFKRGRGKQKTPTKVPVSMRLDDDVLAFYRAHGRGWQTRANAVLRSGMIEGSSVLVLDSKDSAKPVYKSASVKRDSGSGQFVTANDPVSRRTTREIASKKKAARKTAS